MISSTGTRWQTITWRWAAVGVTACVLALAGSRPQLEAARAAARNTVQTTVPLQIRAAVRTSGRVSVVQAGGSLRARRRPVAKIVTLHVYTVPPEPGVELLFDGHPAMTDADGVAVINTPYQRAGHTLKLVRSDWTSDNGRIETKFTVWRSPVPEQKHSPTLTGLILRRNHAIQLGFRVSYQVNFSFVTTANTSVPSSRVSGVQLRADGGYISSVEGGQTIRLLGVQPVEEAGALIAHTVIYTLQSVIVDGSNVVNAGQQRVSPTRQLSAKFVLQLRQLTITAHDRLFDMHVGSTAVVTYPDGRRVSYRFDRAHQVVLTNLARGKYQVRIEGGGFLTSQTVVLSRNQIVNMPILTWLDIVMLIVILTVVAVAAILRQRRGRRTANAGGRTE